MCSLCLSFSCFHQWKWLNMRIFLPWHGQDEEHLDVMWWCTALKQPLLIVFAINRNAELVLAESHNTDFSITQNNGSSFPCTAGYCLAFPIICSCSISVGILWMLSYQFCSFIWLIINNELIKYLLTVLTHNMVLFILVL
jgi:hypothetical protein